MSESRSEILAFAKDRTKVDAVKQLFDADELELDKVGQCSVEEKTEFDDGIHVWISGPASLDLDALLASLQALNLDYLWVENDFEQVALKQKHYFAHGEESTRRKIMSALRRQSPQVDCYFAVKNKQGKRLKEIFQNPGMALNFNVAGAPILFHLLLMKDEELLKLALSAGADVNAAFSVEKWVSITEGPHIHEFKALAGTTMLMIAVILRHKKMLERLIDAGADVNRVDAAGDAAIHFAAAEPKRQFMIEALLNAGADLNHEGQGGLTAMFRILITCSLYVREDSLKLLKKYQELGGNVQHVSKNGANAQWAVRHVPGLKRLVLKLGVKGYQIPDDFYQGKNLSKKLRDSLREDDAESFAEFIKDSDFNPEIQAEILYWAVDSNRLVFVKQLVEAGVPAQLRWSDYDFPHVIAERKGYGELAEYLRSQLTEFLADQERRLQIAREALSELMQILLRVGEVEDKSSDTYWRTSIPRELKPYTSHGFMHSKPQRNVRQTAWEAYDLPEDSALTEKFLDNHVFVFQYAKRNYGSKFEVRIDTSDFTANIQSIIWT